MSLLKAIAPITAPWLTIISPVPATSSALLFAPIIALSAKSMSAAFSLSLKLGLSSIYFSICSKAVKEESTSTTRMPLVFFIAYRLRRYAANALAWDGVKKLASPLTFACSSLRSFVFILALSSAFFSRAFRFSVRLDSRSFITWLYSPSSLSMAFLL